MKLIIYKLIILSGLLSFCASCSDDNYSEPNSGISGQFIDANTSELVPMPVQGHGSSLKIRMYERDRYYSTGSDHSEMPVDFYAQIDGTYKNTWMFDNNYLVTVEQANFYPIDTLNVTLNGGKTTEQNIVVTPYARIEIVKAEIEQQETGGDVTMRNLKVTYKIARNRHDYKIESSFLAWHISPYIDNASGNSSGKVSIDHSNTPDNDILDTELSQTFDLLNDSNFNDTINKSIIIGNDNRIFIRIGVFTNGKANYSKVVPVTVKFVNSK
jgi:hypothetical protein